MLYQALEKLDRVFSLERAKAHCDIPCGIYDPHHAQIGALTVIRMIDLMNKMEETPQADKKEYENSMTRYIMVKEEHAEMVKHEIRVIYGDYFKQEHIDKYPELPNLVHQIFWQTKNVSTKRVTSPYPPSEEVVYPDL
jgi:nickel superoxide dismutase